MVVDKSSNFDQFSLRLIKQVACSWKNVALNHQPTKYYYTLAPVKI